MIDKDAIAQLAERLEEALSGVGAELDDLREDLGREPDEPGEGSLVELFAIARELAEMARGPAHGSFG